MSLLKWTLMALMGDLISFWWRVSLKFIPRWNSGVKFRVWAWSAQSYL
jgi:hypothetical protein